MQTPNGYFFSGENRLELGENRFNTLRVVNDPVLSTQFIAVASNRDLQICKSSEVCKTQESFIRLYSHAIRVEKTTGLWRFIIASLLLSKAVEMENSDIVHITK